MSIGVFFCSDPNNHIVQFRVCVTLWAVPVSCIPYLFVPAASDGLAFVHCHVASPLRFELATVFSCVTLISSLPFNSPTSCILDSPAVWLSLTFHRTAWRIAAKADQSRCLLILPPEGALQKVMLTQMRKRNPRRCWAKIQGPFYRPLQYLVRGITGPITALRCLDAWPCFHTRISSWERKTLTLSLSGRKNGKNRVLLMDSNENRRLKQGK